MSSIIEIVMIIIVIGFQHFTGYIRNKYLGAILPIAFTGVVLVLLFQGQLHLTFKDIVMPIVGPLVLIGMYEDGSYAKKKKIQKELDKMKAKDISHKNG